MADAELTALLARRTNIINRLAEIDDSAGHALNNPDLKQTDGGTGLDRQGYIDRLEKSLKAVDDAILRHRKLLAAADAGTDEPFETHTKLES